MDVLYSALAILLLLQILIGLLRVYRGPNAPDRMTCVQLFSTMGVAVLLLLAEATHTPALRDVGLVLALLGAVAAVAFVSRTPPGSADEDADP